MSGICRAIPRSAGQAFIISIWAIGGLTLLSIGIIGEYIGKIYLEVKSRPRFFIDKLLLDTGEDKLEAEKATSAKAE